MKRMKRIIIQSPSSPPSVDKQQNHKKLNVLEAGKKLGFLLLLQFVVF
jgi:hypothetical protein